MPPAAQANNEIGSPAGLPSLLLDKGQQPKESDPGKARKTEEQLQRLKGNHACGRDQGLSGRPWNLRTALRRTFGGTV